jgi:hypothetical protein
MAVQRGDREEGKDFGDVNVDGCEAISESRRLQKIAPIVLPIKVMTKEKKHANFRISRATCFNVKGTAFLEVKYSFSK